MSAQRRRPISSWPASLLPSLTLLALLTGGIVTTSSDSSPVVDMTVTTSR